VDKFPNILNISDLDIILHPLIDFTRE